MISILNLDNVLNQKMSSHSIDSAKSVSAAEQACQKASFCFEVLRSMVTQNSDISGMILIWQSHSSKVVQSRRITFASLYNSDFSILLAKLSGSFGNTRICSV